MLQIAFQSTQHTVERLSFGFADAIAKLCTKPSVNGVDLAGHVLTCFSKPDSPYPTIVGIRQAFNEFKILQVVDTGSGSGPALLEMIGNASLDHGPEITDVGQDTGLGEI